MIKYLSDEQEIALWKTWGEYLKYPSCCVDAFLKGVHIKQESIFWGTGFCPCKSCHDKVVGLTYEQAVFKLLSHDPRDPESLTVKGDRLRVLAVMETEYFKDIARNNGLDVVTYREILEEDLRGL